MPQLVDAVRQHTSETNTGQPGQTPGPSQKAELLLGLRSRSRSGGSVGVGTAGSGALEGLLLEEAIGAQRPGNARQRRKAHGRGRGHSGGAHCESTANHSRRLCVLRADARSDKGGRDTTEWDRKI